ncbi:HAD hydrolase-like protein [uncultured Fibrobacter sp.]|uniref:HAD-IIA family hydrolase n=1 Tax=uncultured Fibrobacter sp. TaxID=261512 RepID=UPI002612542F|nr:HAD hydrolase-like protein [uncultured Fibrobacter sp.]
MSEIIGEYDAFCFDGYGTLYNRGDYVYPGAKEWFMELRRAGKELRLVTNAASDVDAALAKSAADRGFDFTASETISSGSLLAAAVKEIRESGEYCLREVFYIGRETGKNVLGACGITAVENPIEPIVAVSSSTATPEMFKHAVDILSHERALLLVLNPDAWAPNIDGSRSPVSGALCEQLRLNSGAESVYLGKPFPEIWERVRKTLPTGSRVLMVGDTLGTDVFGAQVAGFDSALVVGRNVPEADLAADEAALHIRPNFYLVPG